MPYKFISPNDSTRKILDEYGWQAAVGNKFLRSSTVHKKITLIGEVALNSKAKKSFLYFCQSGDDLTLYLFAVPESQKTGPMECLRFNISERCELSQRGIYTGFGIEQNIPFIRDAITRYKREGSMINELKNSDKAAEYIPARKFLSAHVDVYKAMQKTVHANVHRLVTVLTPRTSNRVISALNATLNEIKGVKPVPAEPPPTAKPHISIFKKPRRLAAKKVERRLNPIVPHKIELTFSDIRRQDYLAHNPWGIKASYPGGEIEMHFNDQGQIIKLRHNLADKRWTTYQIGRRPDRTQGSGVEIGIYRDSGENETKNLSNKEFAQFIRPLVDQLAYAKTLERGEERLALDVMIAVNRYSNLGKDEISR